MLPSLFQWRPIQSVATLRVVINNPEIDESVVKQHFATLPVPVRILRRDNTGPEFGAYQFGPGDLVIAAALQFSRARR
jgi:hypothetical protein